MCNDRRRKKKCMIQFLFDCPHLRTEAMVIFNGNKRRKTRMLAFFKWNLEQSFFFSSTKPNQIDIDYAVNDSVSLSFFSINLSFSPHVFIYVGAFIFINLHKEWIPRRIHCVLCVLFFANDTHTHTQQPVAICLHLCTSSYFFPYVCYHIKWFPLLHVYAMCDTTQRYMGAFL